MRGKENEELYDMYHGRITPAYAGKRHFLTCSYFVHKDHPRLCGEKASFQESEKCLSGSPPPMRGKDGNARVSGDAQGITPAYAGKSVFSKHRRHQQKDHPRLCGEKKKSAARLGKSTGSPPPMRGKGKSASRNDFPNGITPAYAGKRQLYHRAARRN